MALLDLQQGLLIDDAGWLWRLVSDGLGDLGVDWEAIGKIIDVGARGAADIVRGAKGIPASPYQYGDPYAAEAAAVAAARSRQQYGQDSLIQAKYPGGFGQIDLNQVLKWGALGLGGLFLFQTVMKKR